MCYHPKHIVRYNEITNKYTDYEVPCRKCIECRQVRANEWGLRGHMELLQHEKNCFITLTYNEETNPLVLHKIELQKFIKRLRKRTKAKIKYFGCGEYGDKTLRPHFHIIIFGYDFTDKMYWKMSKSNIPMYISDLLKKIWKNGDSYIQPVSIQTIKYAALYAAKEKDELPEPLNMFPEFNIMSQNLGIKPILKKMETYLQTDEIYINGFGYQIPEIALEKYTRVSYKGKYFKSYTEGKPTGYIRNPYKVREVEKLKLTRLKNRRERDLITLERVAKKKIKLVTAKQL